MNNRSFRVLIIEPSAVVAAGLQTIVDGSANFKVVELLADLNTLSDVKVERLQPDVVMLDPSVVDYAKQTTIRTSFPCLSGLPVVGIVYNAFGHELSSQFDAVVGLADTASSILKKLTTAAESETPVPAADEHNDLSQRERDILVAVAEGRTNKEIADKFNLSVYTIITHRKNISRKLGINSISGLTVYAIMNKLLDVSDFRNE